MQGQPAGRSKIDPAQTDTEHGAPAVVIDQRVTVAAGQLAMQTQPVAGVVGLRPASGHKAGRLQKDLRLRLYEVGRASAGKVTGVKPAQITRITSAPEPHQHLCHR